MPMPRGDVIDVRLALSNEDLNMNGISRRVQMFFSSEATSMVISSDSMAHGPANSANRLLLPIIMLSVIFTIFLIKSF